MPLMNLVVLLTLVIGVPGLIIYLVFAPPADGDDPGTQG